MNIKNIWMLFAGILVLNSCTPDDTEVWLNPVTKADVKELRLIADHKTLLPDGKAQMEFRYIAYGLKKITQLNKHEVGDTLSYTEVIRDTLYRIPEDQLPEDFIAVYDEQGKPLKNNVFSTTDANLSSARFYAQAGDLKSNVLEIKMRQLSDADEYQEIIYPVVFHLLVPPASNRPSFSVSLEKLQEVLDRLNDIFNSRASNNPNGSSAKITFKLALYDETGKLLDEPGKHLVNLSKDMTETEYKKYLNSGILWDPNRYLNIFIAKFSDSWSDNGSKSYQSVAPNVIQAGMNAIPGIAARNVSKFDSDDVKDFSDVGILLNYSDFFNPNNGVGVDKLELATVLGYYFGLLNMTYVQNWNGTNNLIDGDTDYCPDTYVYEELGNFNIYKISKFDDEYFTTFNIMAKYSRKNSITLDQAHRIRMVTERCPSRWSYKSDWAFTGRK